MTPFCSSLTLLLIVLTASTALAQTQPSPAEIEKMLESLRPTIVMTGETLEHEGGTASTRKYDMTLKIIDANTYVTEVIFKFPGQPDQTIVSMTHRRSR